MSAIQYEIFDDLLIGNFMKTTLHNMESLYEADFNQYLAKYADNGRAETLSEIAYKTRPDKSISLDQMMMAIYRANPEAFINQNINSLKGVIMGSFKDVRGRNSFLGIVFFVVFDVVFADSSCLG